MPFNLTNFGSIQWTNHVNIIRIIQKVLELFHSQVNSLMHLKVSLGILLFERLGVITGVTTIGVNVGSDSCQSFCSYELTSMKESAKPFSRL